jgi:hypothetical protein
MHPPAVPRVGRYIFLTNSNVNISIAEIRNKFIDMELAHGGLQQSLHRGVHIGVRHIQLEKLIRRPILLLSYPACCDRDALSKVRIIHGEDPSTMATYGRNIV